MSLFDGFDLRCVLLPEGEVRVRVGGKGPPLVCLHGNPQTHLMWHKIAPKLAEHFTVYCPDIRGYGISPKPPASDDHAAYSKKAMASDVLALMDHFGHDVFSLVSHDRGARIAHRLCIDHPERVDRLCVMDIVPTIEHFERADQAFATAYAHWFYLIMPAPFPEEIIGNDPDGWFKHHCLRTAASSELFAPEALQDYLAAVRDPMVIRGICEDYRAAAGIDLVHDRQSRDEGRKVQCPVLALWGDKGIIGKFYDPLVLWQSYCDAPVSGASVPSGHYLAEEAPEDVMRHLGAFLSIS